MNSFLSDITLTKSYLNLVSINIILISGKIEIFKHGRYIFLVIYIKRLLCLIGKN